MKISFIEIQNFRKLKCCHIEISPKETLFVGANNSGKTSAMDALILFLGKNHGKTIAPTDFTLSNWLNLNQNGEKWLNTKPDEQVDLNMEVWRPHLPTVDVWIEIEQGQLHYVSHLIPTLEWSGELLGVRLIFEPKNLEIFYKDFREAFTSAQNILELSQQKKQTVSLWPKNLRDFLDKKLHTHFGVMGYILDPSALRTPIDGNAYPQELPPNSVAISGNPFEGLMKIDTINAQRGFSDINNSDGTPTGNSIGRLSNQLRSYYTKHLDPSDQPNEDDLDALEAIESTRATFDKKLREGFKDSLGELENLGYPGFSDPEILLTSRIRPIEVIDHDAAVRFNIGGGRGVQSSDLFYLPERNNGLGYQNLVSMVFSLIRFRDEWMRTGKSGKTPEAVETHIEPLHLVLVEEPEAHLHAQVQQVFIKKAYGVLRNHKDLKDGTSLKTQLVVSTHSSHIAHEVDFSCMRYFRRNQSANRTLVPHATVVNLSNVFGAEDETARFVARYLKTTHCDLFFADGAILVEGPAERMLVPHFIRHHHQGLDSRYISILEIGGSHAHRLRPLIEAIDILTLIITDVDPIEEKRTTKALPELGKSYRSGNSTLKNWVPGKELYDELLACSENDKLSSNQRVRVAYQQAIPTSDTSTSEKAFPSTFEDALALSNIALFKGMTPSSPLLQKICTALTETSIKISCEKMFKALDNGRKAEMALELLFLEEPKKIKPPNYISEGLAWIEDKLSKKDLDYPMPEEVETELSK